MAHHDRPLLEAALLGYQTELDRITAAISDIEKRLGRGRPTQAQSQISRTAPRKKHRISAAGRARIAAAQRKRWAAQKKAGRAA